MKLNLSFLFVWFLIIPLSSCHQKEEEMNILFLHHSVGRVIWIGNTNTRLKTLTRRFSDRLAKGELPMLFDRYNREHKTGYRIEDQIFPKASPYGWDNFPYDYYNIWVTHQGEEPYMEEPTLEMLTKEYQVIIFKHCFPVSNMEAGEGPGDIDSERKTLPNYKLQYTALRDKLHEFPDTKFILFTGAAQTASIITEDEARRAREFFQWVTGQWDLPGDNIYLWDFYSLETEGGYYLNEEYASAPDDPHPNAEFASKAVKLLFNRTIDVIETDGHQTHLSGVKKQGADPGDSPL
jgi:hypothetical protein